LIESGSRLKGGAGTVSISETRVVVTVEAPDYSRVETYTVPGFRLLDGLRELEAPVNLGDGKLIAGRKYDDIRPCFIRTRTCELVFRDGALDQLLDATERTRPARIVAA
jgi:hypothetical protein